MPLGRCAIQKEGHKIIIMSNIETYIFVHDQNIILDFEKSGKFNNLSNCKYVFLGSKPINLIDSISNVIVARDLPHNLEEYPKFTAFTGWYVLWKNNLIGSKYVNLFEYDVVIGGGFQDCLKGELIGSPDFIGYVPVPMSVFKDQPHWIDFIAPYIYRHYNIDIHEMADKKMRDDSNAVWSSTSNGTFEVQTFNEYMMWFDKFVDDLKSDPLSGFAFELSICFFHFIFRKKVTFIRGQLSHFMLGSHNNMDRFNSHYKHLL